MKGSGAMAAVELNALLVALPGLGFGPGRSASVRREPVANMAFWRRRVLRPAGWRRNHSCRHSRRTEGRVHRDYRQRQVRPAGLLQPIGGDTMTSFMIGDRTSEYMYDWTFSRHEIITLKASLDAMMMPEPGPAGSALRCPRPTGYPVPWASSPSSWPSSPRSSPR